MKKNMTRKKKRIGTGWITLERKKKARRTFKISHRGTENAEHTGESAPLSSPAHPSVSFVPLCLCVRFLEISFADIGKETMRLTEAFENPEDLGLSEEAAVALDLDITGLDMETIRNIQARQ